VVSGIAVAVAGGIALQTLFSGVEVQNTHRTGADLDRAQAVVYFTGRGPADAAGRLAGAGGVRGTFGVTTYASDTGTVWVAHCGDLRRLARVPACREGAAFAAGVAAAGWRAARIPGATDPAGNTLAGVLATPAAAARHGRLGQPSTEVFLRLAPGDDALERVRNAVAVLDRTALVIPLRDTEVDHRFAGLRRAILAGAAATILLVGASLLVSLLEQVRDRRRLLAVLAAFGTRRATLGCSVLWQAAVPVALGLALAVAAGAGLGAVLLRLVHSNGALDWGAVATLAGVGAAVVLGVTALSLPPLWRVMRADGLRTE
jgi:hypothetical protein